MAWYEIAIPIYFGVAGGLAQCFRIGSGFRHNAAAFIIGIPAIAVWPIVFLVAWLTGNLYTIKGDRV